MDNRTTPIEIAAGRLYQEVIGSVPNSIIALDKDTVLVETGEFGSYERYPCGYREVIMDRRTREWRVAALQERGEIADALATAAEMRARRRPALQAL